MNVKATHSITLEKYVAPRIPLSLLQDINRSKVTVQLHDTERAPLLARLKSEGYQKIIWVETMDGRSKDIYIAIKPDGSYIYAISNFDGLDKYMHIQLHLFLCGVKEARVESYLYKGSSFEDYLDNYPEIDIPKTPIVIIGSRGVIVKSLTNRILARNMIKQFQTQTEKLYPEFVKNKKFDLYLVAWQALQKIVVAPEVQKERIWRNPKTTEEQKQEQLEDYELKYAEWKKFSEYLLGRLKEYTKLYNLDKPDTTYTRLLFGDPDLVIYNGIYANLMISFFDKLETLNQQLFEGYSKFNLNELSRQSSNYSWMEMIEKMEKLITGTASYDKVVGKKFVNKQNNFLTKQTSLKSKITVNNIPMTILKLKTEEGDAEALVTDFPYGDLSKYFVLSVLKNEPQKLLFMGNCGAVMPTTDFGVDKKKGDLIIPVKVIDQFGNHVNKGIRNDLVDVLDHKKIMLPLIGSTYKGKGLYFGKNKVHLTKHTKIESVLFETHDLLKSWMEDKYGTVDVEVAEIFAAINMLKGKYKPPHVGVVLHVSDVPLAETGESLENTQIGKELGWAKEQSIDYILRFIKFKDVY